MSPFTKLPQDMLQYEINRFLDPVSRAAFNTVLKPDERVYKKLPTDYAMKNEMLSLRQTYNVLVRDINIWLDILEDTVDEDFKRLGSRASKVAKKVVHYIYWMKDSRTEILLKYQEGMKDRFLRALSMWLGESEDEGGDVFLYDHLAGYRQEQVRACAEEAFEAVSKIEFIRHVDLKGFRSVF